MIDILKVLVGSHAHGLAGPNSDRDYRGVFVVPTNEILKIGGHTNETRWIEGNEDDTAWEIGKFLMMATKCNPTVLEVFVAPRTDIPKDEKGDASIYYEDNIFTLGEDLRNLFPYVWNSNDVKNAFIGYGVNQRKKFFDNKDKRAPKYATAYLRVLYEAWQLLSTGKFDLDITGSPIYEQCKRFKAGDYTHGEVIEACWEWETKTIKAFNANPNKETNMEPVNEFLLKVRKEFWNEER